MKKRFISLAVGVLSLSALIGCGKKGSAYINFLTEDNYQGKVEGLQESYTEGDTVSFTVQPKQYFNIDKVQFNGTNLSYKSYDPSTNKYTYSATASAGENKLGAYFKVDSTVDFVDKFDMNMSDKVYEYITEFTESTKADPGSLNKLDFRRDGVEQFRAPVKWDGSKYVGKADTKIDGETYFFNCVDGDTTHMETFNLKYTVKVRYLMVDTQESTSQMEEWGLSGSYFSRYVFWGDQGKEDHKPAHYEQKMTQLFSSEEIATLVGGATHIILMSEKFAYDAANITKADLLETVGKDSSYKGRYSSMTDGNQRDLAIVWYAKTDKAIPNKEDYRCLNLELVYRGFSKNAATRSKNGDYYFEMFDAAALSAKANKRALWSGEKDPFFYYYEDVDNYPVTTMKLSRLYKNGSTDDTIGFLPDSTYCDKMRLWRVEGYVSRKVKNAFYIQDRAEYSAEELAKIKSNDPTRDVGFGIYCFTYSKNTFDVGCHVEVIGALSSYGGSYQMQGLSFSESSPNKNRDSRILDYDPVSGLPVIYDMVPIKLTVDEFHTLRLPQVLVEISENIYFNDFIADYTDPKTGETSSDPVCLGGQREINTMSAQYYKFYYSNNQITLFARYGAVDDSEEVKVTVRDGDTLRGSNQFLRILMHSDITIKYRGETETSYKFFTGGTNEYHTKGPRYIEEDPSGVITSVFTRKMINAHHMIGDEDNGGLVGISNGYISTSGATKKMQITVIDASDMLSMEYAVAA